MTKWVPTFVIGRGDVMTIEVTEVTKSVIGIGIIGTKANINEKVNKKKRTKHDTLPQQPTTNTRPTKNKTATKNGYCPTYEYAWSPKK